MKLVIVESPAKAKTISKYLGKDYTVLASYGHVRDLPSKQGSVNPEKNFQMTWEVDKDSERHIKPLEAALKKADTLVLATDPDREGEAISWHLQEIFKERGKLDKKTVQRITFNAITKSEIQKAMQNPREIDRSLVEAYLARLSLDYLVGFTLSPVLWRKLPGSRSAGRVQSVALRLIVEREEEIDKFISQEYWTIEGKFTTKDGVSFTAKLTHLDGKKLEKFSLTSKEAAEEALQKVSGLSYVVSDVEKKRVKRNPAAPFTTSTLQQEASRKLGMSPGRTMSLAQRLYEGVTVKGELIGLITYMRTDSVQMTSEAIDTCRSQITQDFGATYLSSNVRVYKSRAKNAQEAHEAIRPTDFSLTPAALKAHLDVDQLRLYELIWKRTMASQMASAEFDQVGIQIASQGQEFRATGSTLVFDGFLKLYQEGKDQGDEDEDKEAILPSLAPQDPLKGHDFKGDQHFTQPPPRYSEASLIKRLEELGIGRPSTYTRILQVLQERKYIVNEKKQLHPEERGRLVTTFLRTYFKQYVEYDFTAQLEEYLDEISSGERDWMAVLQDFWKNFKATVDATKDLKIADVLAALEAHLFNHLFPQGNECPTCKTGALGLRLGKFGPFISCSSYPTCSYVKNIDQEEQQEVAENTFETRILGNDPTTGEEITFRKGPYGFYFQWGEGQGKKKPKRVSLPKDKSPSDASYEMALSLSLLPRDVGRHPETGQMITADVGRFGPYIKHGPSFISLKAGDDVLTVALPRALELISNHKPRRAKS